MRNPITPSLNPESHDFQDFRLDVRVRGVQIGLKIVEAVEIPHRAVLS